MAIHTVVARQQSCPMLEKKIDDGFVVAKKTALNLHYQMSNSAAKIAVQVFHKPLGELIGYRKLDLFYKNKPLDELLIKCTTFVYVALALYPIAATIFRPDRRLNFFLGVAWLAGLSLLGGSEKSRHRFNKLCVKNCLESIASSSQRNQSNKKLLLDLETGVHLFSPEATAFFFWRRVDDMHEAAKNYVIRRIVYESSSSLPSPLERYDFVIISGHGTRHSIELGKELISYSYDEKPLFQFLRESLQPKATIILNSCSTGKGEKNFAYYFAYRCRSAIVFGYKEDGNLAWQVDATGKVKFYDTLTNKDASEKVAKFCYPSSFSPCP